MDKRLCEYCKFEIPYSATVCGHCGRDNPYRTENKICVNCQKSYNVKIRIESKKTDFRCSVCDEQRSSEWRKLKAEYDSLQREIDARLPSHVPDGVDIKDRHLKGSQIFITFCVLVPLCALILSIPISLILKIDFSNSFLFAIIIFFLIFFFHTISMVSKYNQYKFEKEKFFKKQRKIIKVQREIREKMDRLSMGEWPLKGK